MKTILVIKLGALGDFVLADAAFRHIYDHHTTDDMDTRLVLLTTPSFQNFAKKQGYFDEVIALPRFKYWNIAGMWKIVQLFQSLRPTHIYDLQMVNRTHVYAQIWSMCARFMRHHYTWIGHIEKSQKYTRYISFGKDNLKKQPLARFDALLSNAGLSKLPTLDIRRLGVEHPQFASITSPYIVIIPSTSNTFKGAKRWPLAYYKELIVTLTQKGYTCVVIGGPGDQHDVLCVNDQVINLTGQTEFAHIIHLTSHAICAIGGDTGPIHMAAASLCPVFVLFSKKALPAAQVGARGPLYYHFSADDLHSLLPQDIEETLFAFLMRARTYREATKFYDKASKSVSSLLS